jgi:hypothetical protein
LFTVHGCRSRVGFDPYGICPAFSSTGNGFTHSISPRAKKISATTAKKSRVIANPEPMKLLAHKEARPSREEIEQMIAKAAYFRAEKRCFEVGYEQEDWLMAEQEINQLYVFES